MEYLLGLVTGLVFLLCLGAAFYAGYRMKPKPTVEEVDEQTKRRAQELYSDFQAIMNYDVQQAMKRK